MKSTEDQITDALIMDEARRIARRKIACAAISGSVIALSAIALITYKAVKTMSSNKCWNDMNWSLDEDCSLL